MSGEDAVLAYEDKSSNEFNILLMEVSFVTAGTR